MTEVFVMFWTVLVFLSVGWYGFLLLYIGIKGGRDIGEMTRNLARRPESKEKSTCHDD